MFKSFLVFFGFVVTFAFGQTQTCAGIGGSCGAISACSKGLLVRRLCPGTSVCCVKEAGLTQSEIHINVVEGYMFLTGYVPKASSGVTIASGYDIGHGPDISGCVGSTIWNLLKPFKNLKSKGEISAAGYDPEKPNLTVSFQQARKIDQCVIEKDKVIAQKCTTKTSPCGTAVLASLAHWCGEDGLINGKENKCAGSKAGETYLKTFCANNGNDSALATALGQLLAAHKRNGFSGTFRETRIQQEISFLKSC